MRHLKSNRIIVAALVALVAMVMLAGGGADDPAHAQAQEAKRRADVQGITRQAPSAAVAGALLDPSDTVVLLLDHQTGLFQTVKDVPLADLRSNVVMLATLMKIPVITTASEPNGTNGPLTPEINEHSRLLAPLHPLHHWTQGRPRPDERSAPRFR